MFCGLVQALALCNALAVDERYDPTTITVAELLTKSRAAAGKLLRGGYHIVESETGDGRSATFDTVEDDDDYVTVVHDGPFTRTYGSSNGTEWSTSENGVVSVSPNDDTVTPNPYAVFLQTLGQTDDAHILGVTQTEPRAIVLDFKPRNGLEERRFYDAKTYLLQRIETEDYRGTTWSQYDDYRRTFGRMIPFHRTYGDAHNRVPDDVKILTFEPVKTNASAFAIPKSKPVFDLGDAQERTIPADFTDDGIVVRVTIAGRGLDFLVDSGASETTIDAGAARKLGLPLYGTHRGVFGGEYSESETRVADFALGDIHARNFALSALPLSWQVSDNQRVVGLLGSDFFMSARIRVSFKDKTLTMESPSTVIPSTWMKLPVDVLDGVPATKAAFNGVGGHFILDLGAFETTLYPHYFAKFKPTSVGDVAGEVDVIGGSAKYREFNFSRFDLGNLAFGDMKAIVPDGKLIEDVSYDGLIGRSFLSHFDADFDYPERAIYLSPLP